MIGFGLKQRRVGDRPVRSRGGDRGFDRRTGEIESARRLFAIGVGKIEQLLGIGMIDDRSQRGGQFAFLPAQHCQSGQTAAFCARRFQQPTTGFGRRLERRYFHRRGGEVPWSIWL